MSKTQTCCSSSSGEQSEHCSRDHDEMPTAAFSKHSCWVCAHREGYVGEPSVGKKALLLLEEFEFISLLSRIASFVNASTLFFMLLCLSISFEAAEAAGSKGSNSLLASFRQLIVLSTVILATVLVSNAYVLNQKRTPPNKVTPSPCTLTAMEKRQLAKMLSGALKIRTVSYDIGNIEDKSTDYSQFDILHQYLEECFPLTFSSKHINKTKVNDYSLLLEWIGTCPELEPVMICAHLDVVPTPNASEWDHDPFGGHIDDDNYVWGRGAIDNKHNVLMQLEALESMLRSGVDQPARTIFFAFGHDEEVGGENGAAYIAEELKTRLKGRKMSFILDEGTFIIGGIVPGVAKPIALIGNCEKGNASLELKVSACKPGHSSMPPSETNIGILARAIQRLEDHPFPPALAGFFNGLSYLGDHLPHFLRLVVNNKWLFGPVVKNLILSKPQTAASVRTTTSFTILNAGEKINVLPGAARAYVNHRIHPLDEGGDKVVEYVRKVIRDPRVEISYASFDRYVPVSPVSPTDTNGFRVIEECVASVFDGAPSMPALMIGNTDTRFYWDLSENIYRFSPVVFENVQDTSMFHGLNERISIDALADLYQFYHDLLSKVKEKTF